jgi:hypothetical protein
MGYQNANRASLADCSARAKVVLMVMALHAKDPGPRVADPLCYYAGWPVLATRLGYQVYTAAAERAVARCISELVDKGYLKPGDKTFQGSRVYELTGLPGATQT